MKQLDAARGPEFDRLFLTFMIQHHQGAVVDGERSVRHQRRGAGRARVQVRLRRQRRSDHRDRPHAAHARRDLVGMPADHRTVPQPVRTCAHPTIACHRRRSWHAMSLSRRCGRATLRSPALACARVSHVAAAAPALSLGRSRRAPPSPIRASASSRAVGRRRGRVEHAARLHDAAVGEVRRRRSNSDLAFTGNYVIQGSYNGYQVWDISQSERSRRSRRRTSARRRRATCRSTRTCCSSRVRAEPRASTAAPQGVKDTVSKDRCAASASSTSPTSRTRSTSPTCRPAAARTRTRCVVDPEGPGQRLRLRLRLGRRALAASCRAARSCRRDRTRTRRCSASK